MRARGLNGKMEAFPDAAAASTHMFHVFIIRFARIDHVYPDDAHMCLDHRRCLG
jgi:hypothetical protein